MAKQIAKQLVLGNFKPSLRDRRQKRSGEWRKSRPGNDPAHLENVRQLPCCICGSRRNVEAHHLKSTGERGMALKSTDRWAVPLCAIPHHAEVERIGSRNEMGWFVEHGGFDALELAKGLWGVRGNLEAMLRILAAFRGGTP